MKIKIDSFVIPTDSIISIYYIEGMNSFYISLIGSKNSIQIKRSNEYVAFTEKPPDFPILANPPGLKSENVRNVLREDYNRRVKEYFENPIVKKHKDEVELLQKKNIEKIKHLYDTFMKHWLPSERFLDINKLAEEDEKKV